MTKGPTTQESSDHPFRDLPPLRESLARLGLLADKSFGQHFLFDLNLCRKIARLSGDLKDQLVLEVGPGPGGLTRALLEAGARVIAIEKDPRFHPILEDLSSVAPGRLTMIEGDAMKVDEILLFERQGDQAGAAPRIVANLPYNVGTALFLKWLLGPWRPSSMTLMFQKEVAHRIIAPEGTEAYGRLSVIAQALCETRLAMDLPARAFTPPPRVDSAVIRAIPREPRLDPALIRSLETLTAAAFGQRRKMLRSSLKVLGGAALCDLVEIDPNARAETVSVEAFLALAKAHLAKTT